MAWGIGLDRLSDNSFLTHLATGRVILDTGHVPTVDLYSFTAPGEPWVVQSWFSSVLFAAAAELGHGAGLRLLIAGILALLVGLAWRLSRATESLLPRVALIGAFVGVGAGMWAERPFLIGLVALALTMLAVERDLDPRWLVPIGWIWVNSHGSFPLGIAYVVVVIVGDRLDGADTAAAVRALKWLTVGVLVGSLNPLGPRLLWFPVELLAKQDALRNIGEWQAPEFTGPGQRLFLVQLAAGLVLLVRRPRYRSALLLVVFGLAALVSARNITVASLVFVPVIAAGLPTVGTLRSSARPALAQVSMLVVLCFAALLAATSLERSTFDLSNYPVQVLDFLDEHQVDRGRARLAHPDVVGNYLE
ncbi:MAG: hypothetical protein M3Z03_07305, partial [Actinomycetota bacterium]|nr:hypothetical protein [Actinomycetota bacterium]